MRIFLRSLNFLANFFLSKNFFFQSTWARQLQLDLVSRFFQFFFHFFSFIKIDIEQIGRARSSALFFRKSYLLLNFFLIYAFRLLIFHSKKRIIQKLLFFSKNTNKKKHENTKFRAKWNRARSNMAKRTDKKSIGKIEEISSKSV